MTDTTKRNRVQAGVPTGGEFAAEQRAENPDLTVPKTAREQLQDALDAGAGGTHAEMLRRYLGAYTNIENNPRRFGERTRIELDQAVEREFALQAEIEALTAGKTDDSILTEMQQELFRLHEWKVTSEGSTTGTAPVRIYNPRTTQTFTLQMSASGAALAGRGRYSIGDLLEGELVSARDYETTGGVEGWRKKFGYTDSPRHTAMAEGSYNRAKAAADSIRPLLGEDYSLYVMGRLPA